jgi:hyaluronate lyase
MSRLLIAFALLAFCSAAAVGNAQSLEIAQLERNYIDYYTAAGADRDHPVLRESLDWLERTTAEITAPGFLRSDGSWSDVDYLEIPTGNWSPWDHSRRLMLMARAYSTPGQRFHGDPLLLSQIENVLLQFREFYPANNSKPAGNWWFWRIGIPLDLGPALVLTRGAVRPEITQEMTRTLESYIGTSPYFFPGGSLLRGQNLVWSSFNTMALGLLKHDGSMLRSVRDAIGGTARTVRGVDGVQNDLSFHQHGPQLYTGGYGAAFANDLSKYVLLSAGTTYRLNEDQIGFTAAYVADSVRWSLFGKHFDASVVGREVSKSSTSGFHGLAALLQMAEVTTPRQEEIAASAAMMMRSWRWTLPVELAGIVADRSGPQVVAEWPTGNRFYPVSDYVVHRRPGWFFSVKMLSTRTRSGEQTNGENILGSRQSDGRYYLSLEGDEYYSRNVWPTLDWSRLPGITVDQRPDAANAMYGMGRRAFVGAVSDGRGGVAAMDWSAIDTPISARKGWFFFDDMVVLTTSGIISTSGHPAETIVQQWPLSSPTAPLIVNGHSKPQAIGWSDTLRGVEWAHADRIGYLFPFPARIEAKREMRSGAWADLGNAEPNGQVHHNPILTLWFDHGRNAISASAVYAIVPGVTAGRMESLARSQPISILSNDEGATAVRDNRTGTQGFIFWRAGAVEGWQVDLPSIVQVHPNRNQLRILVADPAQGTGTMRLTLPGSWRLARPIAGVTLTPAPGGTRLELPRGGGATTVIDLETIPRRRGVVPSSTRPASREPAVL